MASAGYRVNNRVSVGFVRAADLFEAPSIRSALVRANMTHLGSWSWCLSNWLGWLPHLNIEGRVHWPRPAHGPAIGEGVAD
jgi:hypothetical protein